MAIRSGWLSIFSGFYPLIIWYFDTNQRSSPFSFLSMLCCRRNSCWKLIQLQKFNWQNIRKVVFKHHKTSNSCKYIYESFSIRMNPFWIIKFIFNPISYAQPNTLPILLGVKTKTNAFVCVRVCVCVRHVLLSISHLNMDGIYIRFSLLLFFSLCFYTTDEKLNRGLANERNVCLVSSPFTLVPERQ